MRRKQKHTTYKAKTQLGFGNCVLDLPNNSVLRMYNHEAIKVPKMALISFLKHRANWLKIIYSPIHPCQPTIDEYDQIQILGKNL